MFDNLQGNNNQGQGDDLGGQVAGNAGGNPVPGAINLDPKPYVSPLDQVGQDAGAAPEVPRSAPPIQPTPPQAQNSQPSNLSG